MPEVWGKVLQRFHAQAFDKYAQHKTWLLSPEDNTQGGRHHSGGYKA